MADLGDLLWAYKESYRVRRIQSIGREIAGSFIYPNDLVECCIAALEDIGLGEMGEEVRELWDEIYEARYWFKKEGAYLKHLKG